MSELTNTRDVFRLGAMVTAMMALLLAIALTGPIEAGEAPWLIAFGALGAVGIGLMLRARFARVLAGLGALACAVLTPVSLVRSLAATPMGGGGGAGADPAWILSVANAVATTALMTWMFVLAIAVVLGRSWRTTAATARLAGAALVIAAVWHLWLAHQVGDMLTGALTLNVSAEGARLVGFTGWPIWHAVLVVVALILLAGPRRALAPAATGLLVLVAAVVPLVMIEMIRTGLVGIGPAQLGIELTLFGMLALVVYLAWWLRDALRVADARQ